MIQKSYEHKYKYIGFYLGNTHGSIWVIFTELIAWFLPNFLFISHSLMCLLPLFLFFYLFIFVCMYVFVRLFHSCFFIFFFSYLSLVRPHNNLNETVYVLVQMLACMLIVKLCAFCMSIWCFISNMSISTMSLHYNIPVAIF